MEKCKKCHYYFPYDELVNHSTSCEGVESRIECPLCNCDYPSKIIEVHADKCTNCFENMISFISEYSRKKYSHNTIRSLLNTLNNSTHDYSKAKGREVLRTINEDKFNINLWISSADSSTTECPICICEVPLDDIFVLGCNDDHKLCYNCLYQHSLMKLNVNSALTCPIGSCNQLIHVNELRSLPFPKHVVRKLVDKYDKQLFDSYIQNAKGAIICPKNECKWAAILDVKNRVNVTCGTCKAEFCSMCRGLAHFKIECTDMPKLLQEWMTWCNVGRRAREKVTKKASKELGNYKKAQERNEQLKRNFEQLKKDEDFKVQRCKHCPGCKRIVEKIDGCSLMICGQNFHGGDVQNGCGAKFDWNIAKAYKSQLQDQPKREKNSFTLPQVYVNANHYPFSCTKCSSEIIGIRFECINCEYANFCENCEEESTLEHERSHLFRLVYRK